MKIKLSLPITADIVAHAIGAGYQGKTKTFSSVATSSFDADEDTLFFALDGRHTSGEEFVSALAERGIFSVTKKEGTNMLSHPCPRTALLSLASYYKTLLPALQKTVVITGSVGKTTTKEFLRSILSTKWKTHANIGNLNSDIGMPLTVFSTPVDTEILILELGMNHSGEIRSLAECARGDLGIITNIGHAHIGNLGSLENIAREKMDICAHNSNMPVLVLKNQPLLSPLKNKIVVGKDFIFQTESIDKNKKICKIVWDCQSESIKIPIFPREIEDCLFLAIATALFLGTSAEEIETGLAQGIAGDHRRKEILLGGVRIIDDTYNAAPESMKAGLNYLMSTTGKRRHAVLGDMLELGEHTVHLHEELGEHLASLAPDYVYLLGEHVGHTFRALLRCGFPKERIFYFPDAKNYEGLVRILSERLEKSDVCFLKASHSIKLWRVIEGLGEVYSW